MLLRQPDGRTELGKSRSFLWPEGLSPTPLLPVELFPSGHSS